MQILSSFFELKLERVSWRMNESAARKSDLYLSSHDSLQELFTWSVLKRTLRENLHNNEASFEQFSWRA